MKALWAQRYRADQKDKMGLALQRIARQEITDVKMQMWVVVVVVVGK